VILFSKPAQSVLDEPILPKPCRNPLAGGIIEPTIHCSLFIKKNFFFGFNFEHFAFSPRSLSPSLSLSLKKVFCNHLGKSVVKTRAVLCDAQLDFCHFRWCVKRLNSNIDTFGQSAL
jgi:hypothetical protein